MTSDTTSQLCVPSTEPVDSGDGDVVEVDSTVNDVVPDVGPDTRTDTAPTGTIGSTCLTQANCNPGLICGSDAVLGDAVKTTGPLCTQPCCKSEDCPTRFVCYGPGTGGTYCVDASLLPRGASLGGAGAGGSACTTGSQCRSGVCSGTPMTCADTCCSKTDCAGTTQCRRTLVDNHNVFACAAPPAGATGNDSFCNQPSDCLSGICVSNGTCKPRCCGKNSCTTMGYASCAYLQTGGAPEYLPACLHTGENPTGSKDMGVTCATDDECKTAFCDPASLKCTDVCCVEADCTGGTHCLPSSNPHYLTCQ
jgi:hypothetical protein